MATIEYRGECQYRAKIRRKGVSRTRTFESYQEAEEWALRTEGKIVGRDYVDDRRTRDTSFEEALLWYLEHIAPIDKATGKRKCRTQHIKNQVSHARYWLADDPTNCGFKTWSLSAILPWDLREWRRDVLDEDNAEHGEASGPDAVCSPQTALHRLNLISGLFKAWRLAFPNTVTNPVIEGVRPSIGNGRNRRLRTLDDSDVDEEKLLYEAAAKSSRPWLKPAIVLAIETCMRQAELSGLEWDRVWLEGDSPYAFLNRTKNDRSRSVPLSTRAVAAFRELLPPDGVKPKAGKVFPVETPRAFGHAFRDVVKEKEFPDLRWHDLRHEAISRLFERTDLREIEIMSISGHLRHEMLVRYTHLRTRRLAKALG
jgi:integrase